jgi:NO-binding membrane sensor protein with MHYT domain
MWSDTARIYAASAPAPDPWITKHLLVVVLAARGYARDMGDEPEKTFRWGFTWSPWKGVAAWAFFIAMLAFKGVALGYGPAVIAEGITIGLGALVVIMLVIKNFGSD